jgi:uncharacterized protein (DUF983 family)
MASESKEIILKRVLRHRCPACGKGTLYRGLLMPVKRCKACNLDMSGEDSGDGPAFFVITIAGFLVTFLAAYIEYAYALPYLVHFVIWPPVTLLICVLLLRVIKSYLIHLQYRTGTLEGKKS